MNGHILDVFFLIASHLCLTRSHVRFMRPISRSSLWREYPQEAGGVNYNDNQLFCGGAAVMADQNGGRCGICGDNYADPQPRQNEVGGKFYTGFIPPESRYTEGQTIETYLEFTANHLGYVQFKVCAYSSRNPRQEVIQNCLDSGILSVVQRDGSISDRYYIPGSLTRGYFQVILPAGLTCDHCVFQFRYRGGNSWGIDRTTGRSCVGCGDQEEFWGCSDIAISRAGGNTGDFHVDEEPDIFRPVIFLPEAPDGIFDEPAGPYIPEEPFPQQPITAVQTVPPTTSLETYTIATCMETVTTTTMPCCYGLTPGYNDFCMTKSGAECPLDHCRRRNDYCQAGEGTCVFCIGIYPWAGILDRWCFENCLLTKSSPTNMCFCMTVPE